jgi:Na+-driven multidrug efflux pump
MPHQRDNIQKILIFIVLFIIIIGGILVLFIYITRLASNEIFSPSNKILLTAEIILPTLSYITPTVTNNTITTTCSSSSSSATTDSDNTNDIFVTLFFIPLCRLKHM